VIGLKDEKRPAGRPTKYEEGFAHQAYVACSEGGLTDKALADMFNVVESTINLWKLEHKEFKKAVRAGKDSYDTREVESALLDQAKGYKSIEVHEEDIIVEGKVVEGSKKRRTVTKQIIVPTSTIFWLKNRNPKRWRDIKAVEISGLDGGPIKTQNVPLLDLSDFTDEELVLLEKIGLAKNASHDKKGD
jgi:hypothetical protein